tara:strand:+ start:58 stop:306 length:249 start_codon:yes stop_codon:yes gene_type:complete
MRKKNKRARAKKLNKQYHPESDKALIDDDTSKKSSSNVSSSFSDSDSSNWSMSSFDSEASRVNYWKDINTKDTDYVDAVFLD